MVHSKSKKLSKKHIMDKSQPAISTFFSIAPNSVGQPSNNSIKKSENCGFIAGETCEKNFITNCARNSAKVVKSVDEPEIILIDDKKSASTSVLVSEPKTDTGTAASIRVVPSEKAAASLATFDNSLDDSVSDSVIPDTPELLPKSLRNKNFLSVKKFSHRVTSSARTQTTQENVPNDCNLISLSASEANNGVDTNVNFIPRNSFCCKGLNNSVTHKKRKWSSSMTPNSKRFACDESNVAIDFVKRDGAVICLNLNDLVDNIDKPCVIGNSNQTTLACLKHVNTDKSQPCFTPLFDHKSQILSAEQADDVDVDNLLLDKAYHTRIPPCIKITTAKSSRICNDALAKLGHKSLSVSSLTTEQISTKAVVQSNATSEKIHVITHSGGLMLNEQIPMLPKVIENSQSVPVEDVNSSSAKLEQDKASVLPIVDEQTYSVAAEDEYLSEICTPKLELSSKKFELVTRETASINCAETVKPCAEDSHTEFISYDPATLNDAKLVVFKDTFQCDELALEGCMQKLESYSKESESSSTDEGTIGHANKFHLDYEDNLAKHISSQSVTNEDRQSLTFESDLVPGRLIFAECARTLVLGSEKSESDSVENGNVSCEKKLQLYSDANHKECVNNGFVEQMLAEPDRNLNSISENLLSSQALLISVEKPDAYQSAILCDDLADIAAELDTSFCLPEETNVKSASMPKSFDEYEADKMPSPITDFNRFVIRSIDRQSNSIELHCQRHDKLATLLLQDSWLNTDVNVGDVIHVIPGDINVINDHQGLMVVNPDKLISGTTVVSTVQCMRRTVLQSAFKDLEGTNVFMVQGSIIHSLFQTALQKHIFSRSGLRKLAEAIISQPKFLHDIFELGLSSEEVLKEIDAYIPQILNWAKTYMMNSTSAVVTDIPNTCSGIKVCNVPDIEENIWSPRYGVKGKVDLSVEVKIHSKGSVLIEKKLLPLELKTGKPSFSAEHKGQVTLYSMMMSDHHQDPGEGLLLYLKDASMIRVPAVQKNMRGLIQLRNELAYHLNKKVQRSCFESKEDPTKESYEWPILPPPINSFRVCSRCPQLINCSLHRKMSASNSILDVTVEELMQNVVQHLTSAHFEYYYHWVTMLHLEMEAEMQKSSLSDVWCKSAWEREKSGEAFCGMVLVPNEMMNDKYSDYNCLYTFKRHRNIAQCSMQLTTGLPVGERVVVSGEIPQVIAISCGYIVEVSDIHVKLDLDRSLPAEQEWTKWVFRIDRCDTYSAMVSNFSNIFQLMIAESNSSLLRELIIDKREPRFQATLSKSVIRKCKHIMKSLNKYQQKAVFKALMAEDYLLIKGYPGAGKTFTVVALVRCLVRLGFSVLLTSYTHSAVDNILLKLKQSKVDFLRLGRLSRIHKDIILHSAEKQLESCKTVQQLSELYLTKQVVATTCLGAVHPMFKHRRFDYCIVDEASQVLHPVCLGPLFFAKKFVLVGDTKQLGPITKSPEARKLGIDESLLAHLDSTVATVELVMQYRMNSEIMRLANTQTYCGVLQCGSQTIADATLQVQLQCNVKTPWLEKILSSSLEHSTIFLNTEKVSACQTFDSSGHVKNETEAALVVYIVQVFLKAGIKNTDIGVIAPYRNQVALISMKLGEYGVEVNTVDQYQGRDKSIIIVSFVRTSASELSESTGILADKRRLNVAVTRAKHKLVFIGNHHALLNYKPLATLIFNLHSNQIIELPKSCCDDLISL